METCGTCKYNSWDDGVYICGNPEGEYYGAMTAYDDGCEDYEEKD